MRWLLVFVLCSVGALAVLSAAVARPGVPLGVRVPSERRQDPAVRRARRDFAVGAAIATAIAVAVELALPETLAAVSAPTLQVVLLLGAILIARRPLVAAKEAGHWYDGVPVRMFAQATASQPVRMRWWPYIVSSVLCVLVGMHGVWIYDGLPQRIGTHFGAEGRADSWGKKSVLNVFTPVFVTSAMTLLMSALAWGMHRMPPSGQPDGDREAAKRRERVERQGQEDVLALTTVSLSMAVGILTVLSWHGVTGWLPAVMVGAVVVVPLVGVARYLMRLLRVTGDEYADRVSSPSSSRSVAPGRWAETPDDDQFWKGGILYLNRADPRFLVPKRMGMGTTINVGRPAGMAVLVALVLLTVVPILLPLVLDR